MIALLSIRKAKSLLMFLLLLTVKKALKLCFKQSIRIGFQQNVYTRTNRLLWPVVMENKRIMRYKIDCGFPIISNIYIPNPVNVNVFKLCYGPDIFIFCPQLFFGYIQVKFLRPFGNIDAVFVINEPLITKDISVSISANVNLFYNNIFLLLLKFKVIITDVICICIGKIGIFICFFPSVGTVRLLFKKSQTSFFRLLNRYSFASFYVRRPTKQIKFNNHISFRIPVNSKIGAFVFVQLICIHLVYCRILVLKSETALHSICIPEQGKFFSQRSFSEISI